MRLGLLLCLCSCLFALPLQAADGENSIRKALNLSTRQQALTQRIAKIYLALNHNLYEPSYYQERDAAIQQFQDQYNQLRSYAPTTSIQQDLQRVNTIWKDYKAVADWSINKEGAEKLLKICDPMLEASHQLFLSYQAYHRTMYLRHFHQQDMMQMTALIKNAGLQRMLTQRIMLYYLAVKQNLNTTATQKKLAQSIEQYEASLEYLSNSSMNSQLINKKLEAAYNHWKTLSISLKNFEVDQAKVDEMVRTTDILFDIADEVSLLYQDLGHKLSVSNAMNIATSQNVLTQQIAKSYVAMAYSQNTTKHRKELLGSIDLFEEQMLSLARASEGTEEFQDAVRVVQTMWKNYRRLVTSWDKMDEMTVVKVLERANVMMATCDQVSKAIQNYAQTIPEYRSFFEDQEGNPVNEQDNIAYQMRLAGAQRSYSQRLAIYFMMNALNIDTQLSHSRFENILHSYRSNADALQASPLQNDAIRTYLKKAADQWSNLEKYFAKPEQTQIKYVLDESTTLLTILEDLNLAYEQYMDHLLKNK